MIPTFWLLATLTWGPLNPKPTTNVLEATSNRIRVCLIDASYSGVIAKFGLRVRVDQDALSITNTTSRPIAFAINRGFKKYTLYPSKSLELVSLLGQENCVELQPK